MSRPTYVYKLVPSSAPPPTPLPERLPLSFLDSSSGFIHLSTAPQVPGTLKYFFADDSSVYILRVNYKAIESDIRWEDPKAEVCGQRGDEGMFPHLYNGGRLGNNEIDSIQHWEKDNAGWDTALQKAASWLVE
ncbi:hypothetical protein BDQ12DRAFT_674905 [Crucibulum laeve]|uniref:DUF952 domain-containing protein n=1 Tax=Crucibulum laeve TaxID=68775 RepID=A0A5C3MQA4_9AGAR|nr:hypothetical protein BDQ12DRAFT_674905 [Crucibulum laeve]